VQASRVTHGITTISRSGNLTDEPVPSRENTENNGISFPGEVFQYFVGSSGNKNDVHVNLSRNEICDCPALGVRARGRATSICGSEVTAACRNALLALPLSLLVTRRSYQRLQRFIFSLETVTATCRRVFRRIHRRRVLSHLSREKPRSFLPSRLADN